MLVHTEHSRKKSRQCEFCNVDRIQFNDCPSSKDYVLPTSFSLKCLFLNDVMISLPLFTDGVFLDAPSLVLSSKPPQEQPCEWEASAQLL